MLRSHSLAIELSDYSKGLPNEAKERYVEKLQKIGCTIDPYLKIGCTIDTSKFSQ